MQKYHFKLLIISVFLLCLAASDAFCQKPILYYGVKAGPNFANLRRDPNFERRQYELEMFFHAGLYSNLTFRFRSDRFDRMFSVQLETVYSQKGAERNKDGFLYKLRLHMLDLTVLGCINFVDRYEGNRGITFKGGVVPTYLIDATSITGRRSEGISARDSLEIYSYGFQFSVGGFQENITVEGRYELGITDMNKFGYGPIVKQSIWIITIGFRLSHLGRKGSPIKKLKPLKDS